MKQHYILKQRNWTKQITDKKTKMHKKYDDKEVLQTHKEYLLKEHDQQSDDFLNGIIPKERLELLTKIGQIFYNKIQYMNDINIVTHQLYCRNNTRLQNEICMDNIEMDFQAKWNQHQYGYPSEDHRRMERYLKYLYKME